MSVAEMVSAERREVNSVSVKDRIRCNGTPHSLEAEKGILCAILQRPAAVLRTAQQSLSHEHFYVPAHRTIFEAMCRLFDEAGKFDLITLTTYLTDWDQINSLGGPGYLTEIATFGAIPENAPSYIETLNDKYGRRQSITIGAQLQRGEIDTQQAVAVLQSIDGATAGRSSPETRIWLQTLDSAVVRSSQLAALSLSPRRPLLGDWLCEGDYGIIFAPRGVGKTWLALLIAKAVGTGARVGEWVAPNPAKVLYIDGEMPADLMRDRDKGLGSGEVEFLNHAILFDRTEKILNITEPAVQAAILSRCIRDNIRLVVLDNLSTLASGIKENDSFEWERLHNWLLQFRRHKIAVILIHHAGRSGEIRGTSKREDAAFWVIALDDAKKQADDKRGARFISRFTKPSRNTQDEVLPFEWHVVTDPVTGEVSVACKAAQTMDVFRQLVDEGVTECNQLAGEMRVSPGTISKWAKKAMNEGWLRKKGREYVIVEGAADGKEWKRK
jgi:hypothetical protein